MHRLVSESPKIPLQAELLTLSPQALAFIVLITFLTAMVVKVIYSNEFNFYRLVASTSFM